MVTKVLRTQRFIPQRTKVSAQAWPMDRPIAIRLFEQAGQGAGVLCKDLYPLPDHMQVHLLPGPYIHLSSWPSLSPRFVKDQCNLAGFPDSSVGKESAYNAGDLGLIPVSGSSAGEGIGYPLQYSWPSLVAQLVKNLPAMQEIRVWSLGWEDPLEEGKATHSSIMTWRIPRDL